MAEAALQVLLNATKEDPVLDAYGNIRPRKFKAAVVAAVQGRVDDKTVQRFINNPEKMFLVMARLREERRKQHTT